MSFHKETCVRTRSSALAEAIRRYIIPTSIVIGILGLIGLTAHNYSQRELLVNINNPSETSIIQCVDTVNNSRPTYAPTHVEIEEEVVERIEESIAELKEEQGEALSNELDSRLAYAVRRYSVPNISSGTALLVGAEQMEKPDGTEYPVWTYLTNNHPFGETSISLSQEGVVGWLSTMYVPAIGEYAAGFVNEPGQVVNCTRIISDDVWVATLIGVRGEDWSPPYIIFSDTGVEGRPYPANLIGGPCPLEEDRLISFGFPLSGGAMAMNPLQIDISEPFIPAREPVDNLGRAPGIRAEGAVNSMASGSPIYDTTTQIVCGILNYLVLEKNENTSLAFNVLPDNMVMPELITDFMQATTQIAQATDK